MNNCAYQINVNDSTENCREKSDKIAFNGRSEIKKRVFLITGRF